MLVSSISKYGRVAYSGDIGLPAGSMSACATFRITVCNREIGVLLLGEEYASE